MPLKILFSLYSKTIFLAKTKALGNQGLKDVLKIAQ